MTSVQGRERRSSAHRVVAIVVARACAGARVQGAAHAGWPAGSAGLLDQRHLHAARAAGQRDQGVLHAGGSGGRRESGGCARVRADRAGHGRRRALRLQQFGLDRSQAALARNLRTSLIVDPPERQAPAGDRGRKDDRWPRVPRRPKRLGGRWDSAESNQLDDRCLIMAGPGPPMMDAAYNSNYHIVQAPGYVMILTEMIHDVRIIPLDGRPQPAAKRPAVDGRLARPLGGRHAGRRDDQLQRQEPVQGLDART